MDRETRWPTGHGAAEPNTTEATYTHTDSEHLGRNGVLPWGLGRDRHDGSLQSVSGLSLVAKAATRAHARGLPVPVLVSAVSSNPATRCRFSLTLFCYCCFVLFWGRSGVWITCFPSINRDRMETNTKIPKRRCAFSLKGGKIGDWTSLTTSASPQVFHILPLWSKHTSISSQCVPRRSQISFEDVVVTCRTK